MDTNYWCNLHDQPKDECSCSHPENTGIFFEVSENPDMDKYDLTPEIRGEELSALDRQEGGGHYKELVIQPVEYIVANKMEYCEANVVKYVSRHQLKNGKEDILKAIHYLELILEQKYG